MTAEETIGVLLMAYGSPDDLNDMEAYLLDIRGGRPTSPELVEEISERYLAIGGRSPLLDLTRQQGQALEAELNRRSSKTGRQFKVYLGMRHWEPRIQAAVEQMAADGIHTMVALVMAPHNSRLSVGAYQRKLEEAIQAAGADLQVLHIESWHDHPGFIQAVTEKARAARERFGEDMPFVVFTAHSLPSRILAQGDPYDNQLRHTSRLLAEKLGLVDGRWMFSYQSAGQSAEPWLGPRIEDVVLELAHRGEENLLIIPIGFVCDHVEVLYDIDIACKELAQQAGARLERSDSLNASPTLIGALADVVETRLVGEKEPVSR